MTRNSRRPVRRLTESQLRRIVRQEVRRLNESEHTAMGPGGAENHHRERQRVVSAEDAMAAIRRGEDSAEIARNMIRDIPVDKRRGVISRIAKIDQLVAYDILSMMMGQLGMI